MVDQLAMQSMKARLFKTFKNNDSGQKVNTNPEAITQASITKFFNQNKEWP